MKRIVLIILLLFTSAVVAQTPTTDPKPAQITKADLESRLATLQQGLDQAKANLHAYEGAIADCKFWLDQLSKPALTPAPEAKPETPAPMPEPKK